MFCVHDPDATSLDVASAPHVLYRATLIDLAKLSTHSSKAHSLAYLVAIHTVDVSQRAHVLRRRVEKRWPRSRQGPQEAGRGGAAAAPPGGP